MLSFEDCLALCGLTEQEIAAIAEHEHLPAIVAAELGYNLLGHSDGVRRIKRIILDDFAAARARGDSAKALMLRAVFRRFVHAHPTARALASTSGTQSLDGRTHVFG